MRGGTETLLRSVANRCGSHPCTSAGTTIHSLFRLRLARYFLTFAARFRKADGDGLLAAGNLLLRLAALESSLLLLVHGSLDVFAGTGAVLSRHVVPPNQEKVIESQK